MAESADSERTHPPRIQHGSFAIGMAAGFVLSSIFPAPSTYLRSLIVRLFDILAVLLVWTVILIIFFSAYKIGVDKDTDFLSHVCKALKSARQHIATTTVPTDKQEKESVSPSSEFAARPYPFVHQANREPLQSRSPNQSAPSPSATSLKTGESAASISRVRSRSPTKPGVTSSNECLSFRPYDSYDNDKENSKNKRSHWTSLSSSGKSTKSKEKDSSPDPKTTNSPTVSASATRDPNKIPLVAAYVRPDADAKWTKLNGKGLTLKITPEGLLLSDETEIRGGDLKAWMLSLIEHDVSGHSVMRVTTQTNPVLQVVYVFQEDERWKVTLGIHALKRDLQVSGMQVKEVDGMKILGDIEN
ncbi:hypothetical protein V1508DRAFT_139092 [Lipomyces doorenjongii]|uniref:uncharacterized protein n=1 Tax=Lipomyces doorenjongii TaxID=383834 RepID=UPI0034CE0BD4